jgi:hypothetical protein
MRAFAQEFRLAQDMAVVKVLPKRAANDASAAPH